MNKFPRPAEGYHDDLHLHEEQRTNAQKMGEGWGMGTLGID